MTGKNNANPTLTPSESEFSSAGKRQQSSHRSGANDSVLTPFNQQIFPSLKKSHGKTESADIHEVSSS